MRPLDQLAEIAQKAVAIGADLIRTTRPTTITVKSDRDIFTDVDVEVERAIRRYLSEVTPEIGFIGEEEGRSTQAPGSRAVWALDPIDGTANFSHGIPLYATQIALLHDDTAFVCAVSLPYSSQTYWAARGLGAYAGDKRIQVSKTTDPANSIVSIGDYATGDGAQEKNRKRLSLTEMLAARVERIRMLGSAAHDFAWAAEGRTDAVVILSNNTLDIAPGALLATEAGAYVTDLDGARYTSKASAVLAANPELAKALLSLISQ
ncbi:inositol monophosphatase family protein [Saccharothrix mutabilis subsp. mutabilis]|uniref:Inositol monophosphatase family protein n=1 Tax=Saccharothrix mutabilis subsp. mutabilis TaxID=66855 RepID=A0ABP3DAW4_9PSEU